jgi:hypothetical protein
MFVKRRNWLDFGKKTFMSWFIEAGSVPIQRHRDFAEGVAYNDAFMAVLRQVSHSETF